LITALGRVPRQRTTLYQDAPAERRAKSYKAAELAPLIAVRVPRPRAVLAG
jgi:hypothetical protein